MVISIPGDGTAVWRGYSRPEADVCLDHRCGSIAVSNPDVEILRKMHAIAASLGARVIGDEGEEYGPDGEEI